MSCIKLLLLYIKLRVSNSICDILNTLLSRPSMVKYFNLDLVSPTLRALSHHTHQFLTTKIHHELANVSLLLALHHDVVYDLLHLVIYLDLPS